MKLILCSVLVYCILFCVSVAAAPAPEEDDGFISGRGRKADIHDCTGQYLKRKGKLSQDEPTGDFWSMCRGMMDFLVHKAREDYENKARTDLPNELDCVIREFEKNEVTDFVIKVVFYHSSRSVPEDVKKSIETEENTIKVTIATACGIDEDNFEAFLLSVFQPRNAAKSTTSTTEAAEH